MSSAAEGERLLSRQGDSSDEDEEVLFNSPASSATVPAVSSPSVPSRPSEPEGPPPTYSNQQPATLNPISLVHHQPSIPTGGNPPHEVPSFSQNSGSASVGAAPSLFEKPPDYSLHASNGVNYAGKAGMAVHIQMDGRLVPGTIMEDASGRHMVYICQPQQQQLSSATDQPAVRPPCPKDYLFLSFLSLLCCCAPLGFFALIKSLEVHRLYRRGDYTGAMRASKQAHSWGSAAVVFGATIVIIVFALKLYFTESARSTHYYYYQ